MENFGSEYQEIFADQPLQNYYCVKDLSGLVLEGYSNLERYSFFNVVFYPCANLTRDGKPCADYWEKYKFFLGKTVELKLQDNDLNPEDYDNPVLRRRVDMNSPVFLELFQLIYSYLQIVNIETDEDITGLNFFTDHIRKQIYTRYDESFLIASPKFYGDILISGGPIADATLQLAAKVLTEKRQYIQLIDVLGDVGGLMEIIFTFLNIISSFVTEILYDKSLVNNLFSFDLNKKYVVINKHNDRKSQSGGNNFKDLRKMDSINLRQNFKDLENNKNIEVYSKDNLDDPNTIIKNDVSSEEKKVSRRKTTQKNSRTKNSNIDLDEYNVQNNQDENDNNENKLSQDENKNIISIYNVANEPLGTSNNSNNSAKRELTSVYINNWLVCCFFCTRKKSNVNKILFEEGSKLITRRLDIMNMFKYLYLVEIMQKKLRVEVSGMNMSSRCKTNLKIYNENKYQNQAIEN